ncbi:Signal peptidase complex subunit 3, partial [Globisporangium splendens]
MYSVWTRANAVFFTSLMVLAVMCTLTSFSTYLHVAKPIVTTLQLNKLHSLRNYRDRTDRATLSFDLDAGAYNGAALASICCCIVCDLIVSNCDFDGKKTDLSSVFNWNVKQLFVYVVAEYESEKNVKNQVVIWDKIVQTKDVAAKLQFHNEGVEYFLSDQYDQLRGTNVTLRLEWDVMPVCGRLFVYSAGRSSFVLPSTYQGKAPRGHY